MSSKIIISCAFHWQTLKNVLEAQQHWSQKLLSSQPHKVDHKSIQSYLKCSYYLNTQNPSSLLLLLPTLPPRWVVPRDYPRDQQQNIHCLSPMRTKFALSKVYFIFLKHICAYSAFKITLYTFLFPRCFLLLSWLKPMA